MATCYICGKSHAEYRRTVHTGDSNRIGVTSRGRVHTSTTAHYGMRTVCAQCAFEIDYRRKKNAGNWGIGVGILLLAVGGVFFKAYTNFAICSLIFGGLLSFVPCVLAHSEANEWYKENKGKYIDSYDLEQQIKTEKKRIAQNKVIQENKTAFTTMWETFSERINQEMKLMITRGEVFSASHGNVSLNTIEECDKLLAEFETVQKETEATKQTIIKLCDDYSKQCKNLGVAELNCNGFLSDIEKVKAAGTNAANDFINQIKNAENKVLQAKIDILKG